MISLYFGLPGCGKTTILAKIAHDTDVRIDRAKKGKTLRKCPYKMIYGNIPLEGIKNYRVINFDWLGRYDLRDCLILIDEATIEADNREYKTFVGSKKDFFLLHRHYCCDVIFFSQSWDSLDKRIRTITDRVYYVYKGLFTRKWFTRLYRVPYGIIIPDPKKDDSEKLGEIIQGYCKPNIFIRLFSPWVFRPRYYKYFDSWDAPVLLPLPLYQAKSKLSSSFLSKPTAKPSNES